MESVLVDQRRRKAGGPGCGKGSQAIGRHVRFVSFRIKNSDKFLFIRNLDVPEFPNYNSTEFQLIRNNEEKNKFGRNSNSNHFRILFEFRILFRFEKFSNSNSFPISKENKIK